MSTHPHYPRAEALGVYHSILEALHGFYLQATPVGSLRRELPEVGDIDIHFEIHPIATYHLRKRLEKMGRWNRGGFRLMVIDNILDSPFTLELGLIYPPRNWWSMLAIKTGPASFQQWMRKRLADLGVPRPHGEIQVLAEEAFFTDVLKIPFVTPVKRTDEWVETLPEVG